jgi:tetratricopeptide (TPR) repeat protein
MTKSSDNSFRDRVDTNSGSGLKTQGSSTARPSTEGLKLDTGIELPDLGGFTPPSMGKKAIAEKMKGIPRAAQSNDGLKVDADLGTLGKSIKDINLQQQNSKIRGFLEEAQRYISQKNFKAGLASLEKALSVDSTSVPALYLKAFCYFSLNDYYKALEVLQTARTHLTSQNQQFVILLLILQAACSRAIAEAFQGKLGQLLEQERYNDALTLIDDELRKHPGSGELLYYRCGVYLLMDRLDDAKRVATDAMHRVVPSEAGMFQEMIEFIQEQEASHQLEVVRNAIRRGDLRQASHELDAVRHKLGQQPHTEAIANYVDERRNPQAPKKSGGFLGGLFGGRSNKPKVSGLQQILMWILAEELASGMSALEAGNFAGAISALSAAERIDGRCVIVAYLYGLSAFKAFEQVMEGSNGNADLQRVSSLLETANSQLSVAASDPSVAQQTRNLQSVVSGYYVQVLVAQCVQEFNTMMSYFEQHPISDYSSLSEAKLKVSSQLVKVASTKASLPRGAKEMGVLNQIERTLKDAERQLNR